MEFICVIMFIELYKVNYLDYRKVLFVLFRIKIGYLDIFVIVDFY